MDDVRILGVCECGNEITDADEVYFVDDEGRCFCSVKCALEHYNIATIEV